MKKLLCITVAALAISTAAQAQKMSIGPTIGYGHSWTSEEDRDADYHHSYNAGITFVYSTMSKWGWGADLKYSAEGVRYRYSAFGDDYESKLRLDYIRIPVRAYYFFADYGQPIRPKVGFGPSLGILTGGKYTTTNLDADNSFSSKIDNDDFRTADLGLNGLAGVNFRLGEDVWLNTDVTYYHGFTDIVKSNEGIDDDARYSNRNIGVNVGLTIGIGRGADPFDK